MFFQWLINYYWAYSFWCSDWESTQAGSCVPVICHHCLEHFFTFWSKNGFLACPTLGLGKVWARASRGCVFWGCHLQTFPGPPLAPGAYQGQQVCLGGAPGLTSSPQCPLRTSACPLLISFMVLFKEEPPAWCCCADWGWLSLTGQDGFGGVGYLLLPEGPWAWG